MQAGWLREEARRAVPGDAIRLAKVHDPDGEGHAEILGDDVLVEVELQPDGRPATVRLGGVSGCGPSTGVWSIPPVGVECFVAFPGGDVEEDGALLCVLLDGVPDGLTADGDIVIVPKSGRQVYVHDGDKGDTDALVTKSEFEAHDHRLDALQVQVTSGSSAGTYPIEINPAPPPPDPGDPRTEEPDSITGTIVLKAE